MKQEDAAVLRPGEALLRLRENPFDSEAIRAVVGGGVAKTHAEVAREFGVQPSTVRQSWVPAGMPGEKGCYRLAEIAEQRLRHLAEADRKKRSVEDLNDAELKRRTSEAEARKLELQADRLEREEQTAMGNLISRSDVVAVQSAINARLAETLVGIPDKLAPMLPVESSAEMVEEIRGEIARALKGFTETSARDVMRGK